jgi:two-component system OmpR family sensor kinase
MSEPATEPSLDLSTVDEFASLIGHELRTPLAVIQGSAQVALLEEERLSVEQRQALSAINRNAELGLLLLERLAAARLLERGELTLSLGPVDLAELARTAIADLTAPVLAPHSVSLEAPDGPVLVRGDERRLRQVLFNLLSNAAHFSRPHLPIVVTVRDLGDRAELEVRDHGDGVAPADVERVFQRFTRLAPDQQGLGLGLFVSRGIARAHGGDLTAEAAEDAGSRFRLTLPPAGGD